MKPLHGILAAVALLAIGAVGYWMAVPTVPAPPAPPIAPPAVDRSTLAFIVQDLADPDSAVQTAARERLAVFPPARRRELRLAAEQATTLIARQRLLDRLSDIDAALALLPPPPLSLHVKDASLTEVLAQLAQATDADLSVWTSGGSGKFTLDADNQPFWEIIMRLDRQVALTPRGGRGQLMFAEGSGSGEKLYSIQGPFILLSTRREKTPTMTITLAADPRVIALGERLTFTCFDAAGRELKPAGDALQIASGMPPLRAEPDGIAPLAQYGVWMGQLDLQPVLSQNPGSSIASIKVHGQVPVAVRMARLDIPDPESHVHEVFTVANDTVTLTTIRIGPSNFTFGITAQRGTEHRWFTFRLVDARNTVLFGSLGAGNFGGGGGGGGAGAPPSVGPPYTLQVNLAQEVKAWDVDFELKAP